MAGAPFREVVTAGEAVLQEGLSADEVADRAEVFVMAVDSLLRGGVVVSAQQGEEIIKLHRAVVAGVRLAAARSSERGMEGVRRTAVKAYLSQMGRSWR